MSSWFVNPDRISQRRALGVRAVILLAQLPLLWLYARDLWGREHYQFYPLFLLAAAAIGYGRWNGLTGDDRCQVSGVRVANWWLGGGFVVLAVGTLIFSHLLAAASAVMVIGAVLLRSLGWRAFPSTIGVWALLWIIVPLPMGFDFRLIQIMQGYTASASSMVLEVFGVLHLLEGNVIQLPERTLFVEEACSGVQSLFALFAATALYVVWMRRPFLHGALLLLSAVFWAGVGNVARIVVIVLVLQSVGLDLTSGWRHETLGLVEFALALGLMVSTDRFLGFWVAAVDDESPVEEERSWLTGTWNWVVGGRESEVASGEVDTTAALPRHAERDGYFDAFSSWIVAGLFLLIGLAQVGTLWAGRNAGAPVQAAEAALGLEEVSLPEQEGEWVRVKFDTAHREESSSWGEFSRSWSYASPVGPAMVSCDFPFTGWHNLSSCYQSQGWRVESRRVHAYPGGEEHARFVELEMQSPDGLYGHLVYGLFDVTGRDLTPEGPEASVAERLYFRLLNGLDRGPIGAMSGKRIARTPSASYQMQLLATSEEPFDVDRMEQLRDKFVAFRDVVRVDWDGGEF